MSTGGAASSPRNVITQEETDFLDEILSGSNDPSPGSSPIAVSATVPRNGSAVSPSTSNKSESDSIGSVLDEAFGLSSNRSAQQGSSAPTRKSNSLVATQPSSPFGEDITPRTDEQPCSLTVSPGPRKRRGPAVTLLVDEEDGFDSPTKRRPSDSNDQMDLDSILDIQPNQNSGTPNMCSPSITNENAIGSVFGFDSVVTSVVEQSRRQSHGGGGLHSPSFSESDTTGGTRSQQNSSHMSPDSGENGADLVSPKGFSSTGSRAFSPSILHQQSTVTSVGSNSQPPAHRRLCAFVPVQITSTNIHQKTVTYMYNPKRPREIPTQTFCPFRSRCKFCQKNDYYCYQCNGRWIKEEIPQRAQTFMTTLQTSQPPELISTLFLTTIAHGDFKFFEQMLKSMPKAYDMSARFVPMPEDNVPHHLFENDFVFPLHVAFAYSRLKHAKKLLEAGAKFRRSRKKLFPTQYCLNPSELDEEWHDLLDNTRSFQECTLTEMAKDMRTEERWDDAESYYAEAETLNPRNEHVLCGRCKMAFDRGMYHESMRLCLEIMNNPGLVEWVEFDLSTIENLCTKAVQRWHDVSHSDPENTGALKACGCVVLNDFSIDLRRLPFQEIIEPHIISFFDAEDTVMIWQTFGRHYSRWNNALVTHADCTISKLEMTRLFLSNRRECHNAIMSIKADFVRQNLPIADAQFKGLKIQQLQGFLQIAVLVIFVGKSTVKKRFSFGKPDTIAAQKVFVLCREHLTDVWHLGPDNNPWTTTQMENSKGG